MRTTTRSAAHIFISSVRPIPSASSRSVKTARGIYGRCWRLVPPASPDIKTGLTLFNARVETILEKRICAEPFAKGRRCLVPIDGFYELTGAKGAKQPHLFRSKDGRIMAFAGLWETCAARGMLRSSNRCGCVSAGAGSGIDLAMYPRRDRGRSSRTVQLFEPIGETV